MEPFKLPFPSLQFLASHAVVRCLSLMKANKAYWLTSFKGSLRKCELRVDKLPLPPPPREYVRSVLRGFFFQVRQWIRYNSVNPTADILVDARGNLDERRMAKHHFEKRYKDQFYRQDFELFVGLLAHFSWHYPKCCSNDFVSIIVSLQKVNASLEGPEYRLVGEFLRVVFRFVNVRKPPEFNALLEWKGHQLRISVEQKDILVAYSIYKLHHHDKDMFKIHLDLLQPSQKLEFVKQVLHDKMASSLSQQVICFLNVLGPELRRNSLLCLKEDQFRDDARCFVGCWLLPGYESLFIPMMKLVGMNLGERYYFYLFEVLVNNIDLIGFDSLLFQFWKLLPASRTSDFHVVLEDRNNGWHNYIKEAMKKLSRVNMALCQVVFDDVTASPPKKKVRHAL